MKSSSQAGFTLLEVLTAFVIAAMSLTWFLYVLSHTYSTTARLLERLRLYDVTIPLQTHLLTELASGTLTPEELKNLAQDEEALSSYTIPRSEKIVLKIISKPRHASFSPGAGEYWLNEWILSIKLKNTSTRIVWNFYTPEQESP